MQPLLRLLEIIISFPMLASFCYVLYTQCCVISRVLVPVFVSGEPKLLINE
jgi:hypothetical protein